MVGNKNIVFVGIKIIVWVKGDIVKCDSNVLIVNIFFDVFLWMCIEGVNVDIDVVDIG